jgi:hypothetical protein
MRVKALALIELELVGISTSGSPARLALPHLVVTRRGSGISAMSSEAVNSFRCGLECALFLVDFSAYRSAFA